MLAVAGGLQDLLRNLHEWYDSIQNSDLPMIQGTVLIGAFFIILANLVVDVIYAFLDPRVRYS